MRNESNTIILTLNLYSVLAFVCTGYIVCYILSNRRKYFLSIELATNFLNSFISFFLYYCYSLIFFSFHFLYIMFETLMDLRYHLKCNSVSLNIIINHKHILWSNRRIHFKEKERMKKKFIIIKHLYS